MLLCYAVPRDLKDFITTHRAECPGCPVCWLIDEIERLEDKMTVLNEVIKTASRKEAHQTDHAADLRQALEYYADAKNWLSHETMRLEQNNRGWEVAKLALAQAPADPNE